MAELLCEKGEFSRAQEHLIKAKPHFYEAKDWASYLRVQTLLLRTYAEMELFDRLNEVKEELQDLVIGESVELTPKTYYTLALCSYKGTARCCPRLPR